MLQPTLEVATRVLWVLTMKVNLGGLFGTLKFLTSHVILVQVN